SLGNVLENPHIGLLFVDFFRDTIGLHVNGRARAVENETIARALGAATIGAPRPPQGDSSTADDGPRPERWVVVEVEEAYIHCSKHIPLLQKLDKAIAWGTDDMVRKGGDYFN